MYSVLIAEDELLVRIGMVNCVPWSKLGMRIVDEVADGLAAWKAFQQYRPDIIITDIRMPEMDGLELLRRIRSADPNCAIVVVTNVENDETMEEVRRLGSVSILLKAVMTRDDIVEAVIRARDSLQRPPRNTDVESDHGDLWRAFVLDGSLDHEMLCQKFSERGSAPEQIRGMVLAHLYLDGVDARRLKYSMVDIVEHRLQETNSFLSIETMTGALLLLTGEIRPSELEYALKELAWYIETHFAVKVHFVLQPECDSLRRLPEHAARAMRLIREARYFDEAVLLLNRTGKPDFQKLQHNALMLKQYEALSQQSRYRAAMYGTRLEQLTDMLDAGWNTVCSEGSALLNALGENCECDGLHSLVHQLTEAAEAAVLRIESNMRPEVLNAMAYIEDHLEEDLSIQNVSRIVNYHYAYFSNLFKKETGMNYSDFVAKSRINRAKSMLLSSECTLQEIADKCGFKNVPYFCSKFKHVTGMTPGQWRERS